MLFVLSLFLLLLGPRRKKERKRKGGRRGNRLIRCSTSDRSGMCSLPLANFAFAVTSAVRRTEMYAETGVTGVHGEPRGGGGGGIEGRIIWRPPEHGDVPERRYPGDTSPDLRNLRSHKRQVAGCSCCIPASPIRFFRSFVPKLPFPSSAHASRKRYSRCGEICCRKDRD